MGLLHACDLDRRPPNATRGLVIFKTLLLASRPCYLPLRLKSTNIHARIGILRRSLQTTKRAGTMRTMRSLFLAGVSMAAALVMSPAQAQAQATNTALSGTVSSAKEGAMEGVLVSARKDG